MTSIPEMDALFNGFGGLATFLIAWSEFNNNPETFFQSALVMITLAIGGITFTGSLVAYGKLSELITGKALVLPGRHVLNILMTLACLVLGYMFLLQYGLWTLIAMTIIAFIIGAHLVLAIGGADMPVVVSMLNSYSVWALSLIHI